MAHSTGNYRTIIHQTEQLEQKAEAVRDYNPREQEDKTRSTIAITFVKWYFVLISLVFLASLVYNFILMKVISNRNEQLLNPKDLILVISSTVGTSLGFIVGYYFKSLDEKGK